ncbi:VOC family protein [Nocardia jejuensis]|uniref:VOC family protein n=1 Tax=Nocardia jejuensis TaxID=328049 RepID=UPI00082F6DF2|nr:VOC family protein [Nocardia jejuensis]
MSTTTNTVTWFQLGSNDPAAAKSFYGDLFGWTFFTDPNGGGAYDLFRYADGQIPVGGVAHTEDASDNHGMFLVEVADVVATLAEAERLGGKALTAPITNDSGLVFAYLVDNSGIRFGIFTPAP